MEKGNYIFQMVLILKELLKRGKHMEKEDLFNSTVTILKAHL